MFSGGVGPQKKTSFFLCFWLDNRPTHAGAARRAAPLERGWAIKTNKSFGSFFLFFFLKGDNQRTKKYIVLARFFVRFSFLVTQTKVI